MKKLNLIGFISLLVFLVGCQPSSPNKKSRITGRGGANVEPIAQTPQGSSSTTKNDGETGNWGEILRGAQSQQQFQNQVRLFTSNITDADGNPIALGNVSGDSGQKTGIRFWGSALVNGNGGKISLNGQNNFQITAQGSALRIGIFDEYVGQQNSAGETITEIPIYIAPGVEGFVNIQGAVQGNQAQIQYRDNYGVITVHGTFDSNWFTGSVSFQNNAMGNIQATSGTLGSFYVRTCGFFKCQ